MRRSTPLVTLFIVLNVIVYILWLYYDKTNPGLMVDNFLVSWDSLREGRYWTLVTSEFSHNMLWHIFINMFVLRSFGGILERVLGSFTFFKLYIFAAIVASFGHAFVSSYFLHQPDLPALGASGAICGIIFVFALMFPREKILLFAIIPMPAMVGALGLAALDVWGLISQAGGGGLPIGHGAHLGGAVAGIIYYVLFLRGRPRIET